MTPSRLICKPAGMPGLPLNRMPTRGVRFDPAYHEAVGRARGAPDGIIVQEVRAGYCIGETVLRPAQVIVAVQETPRRPPYGI